MADNVIVRVPEQQIIKGEDGKDGASAYEQAVAGGYTGTEAQFNEELASFKELSEQAADSAAAAAQSESNAAGSATTATTKAQEAADSAAQALIRMNSADASAQAAATTATTFTEQTVPAAVNTINEAKADALTAVGNAQTTAVGAVQQESTTQQAAIQQKGDDVLESIPPDYTELSEDVDDLKSAVDNYVDALQLGLSTEVARATAAENAKVNKPSTSPNGTSGQLLRTNGDGTTTWVDQGLPTDAQTAEAVSDWLDDHPEATTTVQDNSVTDAKLVQSGGILDTARKLGQHNIFTELYNARYVGHKGFNGWISGTTAKPAVQSNSLMALDLAKSLGIKFVETDTTILSDGTWVISHDLDTQNMSGELAELKDITLADFKARKVIKEYLTSGTSWVYSAEEQFTAPTLEEYLLRAKELGLYVLPEIKWFQTGFTDQNYKDFADTVISCGMENQIAIYTAYTAYMRGCFKYLPNTAVCNTSIKANNADEIVEELKKYPYAFACTGETNYSYQLGKCIEANIPLGLWVVDDYSTASAFLTDGGTYIVTDCITDKVESDRFFEANTWGTESFFERSSTYTPDGSAVIADGVITLTSGVYLQKYLHNMPINPGDVIYFSAKVKTNGVGSAQVFINNITAEAIQKRRVLKESPSDSWEEITIVYVASLSDTLIDIAINFYNMTSTSSSAEFKDIVIKHFTLADTTAWKQLTNVSYKKSGNVVTVTRDSNISVPAHSWTAVDQLPVDYRPSRTIEYIIAMGAVGTVNGLLKIDRYGTISLYAASEQTVQYYTVTFIV